MKLWKKVYLFTLIIITLTVNLGFVGIIYVTYQQMLQGEKNRCEAEFYILQQSISADVEQIEQGVGFNDTYFRRLVRAYESYYDADTYLLGVGEDGIFPEESAFSSWISEENGLFIENEDRTVIYMVQPLDNNHSDYRIVMVRTLDEFDETWRILMPLYLVSGVLLSFGVSIILALTVRTLLKPLDLLEEAAAEVKKGNWSSRVSLKGNNELVMLGNQFNAMADSVESNIGKLEEQSRQKEELIHNLAHEMNTPITSIKGFADYLKMSAVSKEEEQECLEFIIGESDRLKNISSALLSMARLKNNEEMEQNFFDLKELCQKLEELYTRKLETKGISFSIDCKVNKMKGNEALIESLLRNLIDNGRNALWEKKEGRISVDIFSREKIVTIKVSDNGCGMEQSQISRIFEPFYRVDKARSRENGGSGLGLPFCEQIVKMHGGNIKVESEIGKGTSFIITFTI